MAARRAAQGAYSYRARTISNAFRAKRAPSSTSKAGRRQARASAARGRLPAPGTIGADRIRRRYLPATEEVRFLKRATLDETLAGGRGEYRAELDALADRAYREAYNAQQRTRRAAKPKKPKPKSARVNVRAHRRRRAGA